MDAKTSGRPKHEELFGSQKRFKSYLEKGQRISNNYVGNFLPFLAVKFSPLQINSKALLQSRSVNITKALTTKKTKSVLKFPSNTGTQMTSVSHSIKN